MAETLIKNFVNKFENEIIITTVVTEFLQRNYIDFWSGYSISVHDV